MGGFGIWHWLIVIILVMLLFGKGRISDMMGDLGKGLKSFKQGIADEDDKKADPRQAPPQAQIPPQSGYQGQPPIDITPQPRPAEPAAPPPPSEDRSN